MLKPAYLIAFVWSAFFLYAENIDVADILKKAEAAYKKKNYTESIQLYHRLVDENYYSPELYYNLGNAYFKNNQLGKAILYYEKAKKLNPSDKDLEHNLKLAYSKTIDKIETRDNFFVEITKNNFLSRLNTDTLAYTSIMLSALAAVFFGLFLSSSAHRKTYISLTIILIFTSLLSYGLGILAQSNQETNDFAIVTAKESKVTNEPLPNAITKFKLHEGTKVKVLQKVDEFVLIRLDNGTEGWVEEKSIEVI
ncbi:MAG: tetratricopeptide repeat protein [Bacteroidia bacterium]